MASIYKRTIKRKDGTTYEKWTGKVTNNYNTKTFYGKSKKEVENEIRLYQNEIEQYGFELDKTPITLSDLVYKHLFTNSLSTVQTSSFERYMCLYNNHIKSSKIGEMKIVDIKQSDIQKYFNGKVKKEDSIDDKSKLVPKTLKTIRYLLKQAFEFAMQENYLRINPSNGIKIPTTDIKDKEISVLTLDEQEKYIQVLGATKYKLLFFTALFTGMRMGELIALKWENVDLDKKIITVCESYKRTKKYSEDGTDVNIIDKKAPKTKNGNREINIPEFLAAALKAYKDSQVSNTDNLVFITASGQQMSDANLRRIQIALCKKADIPYKNFHALRHTYATRLIENGSDVKTVSRLLGHADIQTTLNIYVHSTDDSKRSAADTLENQFKHLMV
jgi:integrase